MATRAERRKAKYNKILKTTGNVDLARQYRDKSNINIKRELGIDLTEKKVESQKVNAQLWSEASKKKSKVSLPKHVEAYAIEINRKAGADDYSNYGFIYAYKRLVEGKGPAQINREVIYDRNADIFIYRDISSRG
jgi:hypothetical protein